MQPTFTKIKNDARNILKGRWPEAMLVSVSFLAVCLLNTIAQGVLMQLFKVNAVWSPFSPTNLPDLSIIASIGITIFSSLYTIFLSSPFLFGVLRWFWLLTNGVDVPLNELFYFFSSGKIFWKSVRLSLGVFLRIVFAAGISLLPYVLWSVAFDPALYDHFNIAMPIWMSGLFPIAQFLKFIGLFFFVLLSLRCLVVYIPLNACPELSVRKMFGFASRLIHGRLFRFLGFLLSFFGWFLLSLLCLPLLFTLPFFLTSLCIYGKEEYKDSVKSENFKKF